MRKFKVWDTEESYITVEGQVFTAHIPPYSGASLISWQFFYVVNGAHVACVYEKISGCLVNTFYPTSTLKTTLKKRGVARY